jgi:hypothetical protein
MTVFQCTKIYLNWSHQKWLKKDVFVNCQVCSDKQKISNKSFFIVIGWVFIIINHFVEQSFNFL